jgi:hypothetical protein
MNPEWALANWGAREGKNLPLDRKYYPRKKGKRGERWGGKNKICAEYCQTADSVHCTTKKTLSYQEGQISHFFWNFSIKIVAYVRKEPAP